MKQIIDSETGEVIDVQENEDKALVELKEQGIITSDYLDKLEELKELKEQVEYAEMMAKDKIKDIFKKYNITSLKTDNLTITLRKEHMMTRVDTKKLKDDGLYDKYSYLSPVQESISFKLKDEKYGG